MVDLEVDPSKLAEGYESLEMVELPDLVST